MHSGYLYLWIIFVTCLLILEGIALYTRKPGRALTHLYRLKLRPWYPTRMLVGGFLTWLWYHFIIDTGGPWNQWDTIMWLVGIPLAIIFPHREKK